MNPPARVASAASKVAPASREAIPPGSADPPGTSAVCAVDAELRTGLPETDMIEEPLNNCSSICSADGSPGTGTRGLSLRCVEFSVAFAASPLSVVLCRFIASKTLPIESPHHCSLFFVFCSSLFWYSNKEQSSKYKVLNPYHCLAFPHSTARLVLRKKKSSRVLRVL